MTVRLPVKVHQQPSSRFQLLTPRLVAQLAAATFSITVLVMHSLPPSSYSLDFFQSDYIYARALRDGLDSLGSNRDLVPHYFPALSVPSGHPTSHPPFLSIALVPLSLIPYEILALLWLGLGVALLLAVGRRLGLSVFASLALAAWPPVFVVLWFGQWEPVTLALAMIAWSEARQKRDWRAGLLFALAATIKLYPAFLVVPFLLRRRLAIVVSAALGFLVLQAATIPFIGIEGLVRYWTVNLPTITQMYLAVGRNASAYGALLRLLGGAKDTSSPVDLPWLVLPLAIAIALMALFLAGKAPPEAAPLAMTLVLLNVWGGYLYLTLPTVVRLWQQRSGLVVWLGSLALSCDLIFILAIRGVEATILQAGSLVPLVIAVIGSLQALGCGLLLWLTTDRRYGELRVLSTSGTSQGRR